MSDVFDFRILAGEATLIIQDAVAKVLDGRAYQSSKVSEWNKAITDVVLRSLLNLSQNFKYVVSCVIFQKNGAALDLATSCCWDPKTDAVCSVQWENKVMFCVVSVFGCSL